MKTRPIFGLLGFVLTLLVMIPTFYLWNRGAATANHSVLIALVVLGIMFWMVAYMMLVDPLLRRLAGSLFGVAIEWRGVSSSISWTPMEKVGCLFELFINFLGFAFIILGCCHSSARSGWPGDSHHKERIGLPRFRDSLDPALR